VGRVHRDLFSVAKTLTMEEDKDAPEEVTLSEGKQEADELRKIERENNIRVATEAKQRRKQQTMKKELSQAKPETDKPIETAEDARLAEELGSKKNSDSTFVEDQKFHKNPKKDGMLPESILNFLADREKQSRISLAEKATSGPSSMLKPTKKKMKIKRGSNETGRVQLVVLQDMSSSDHIKNAKQFQQSRQSLVQRSPSMLQRAAKAFPLLSKQGRLH